MSDDEIYGELAALAAAGIVECAWDDEKNEMVFWLNQDAYDKEQGK